MRLYFAFIILGFIVYKKTKNVKKTIVFLLVMQYLLNSANPFKFKRHVSKKDILDFIPNKYKPRTEMFDINKKYEYPFVLKPNICTATSIDVKVIEDEEDLEEYLDIMEEKSMLDNIIYQDFVPYEYEVGVLYERNPWSKNGQIVSIVRNHSRGNRKIKPTDYIKAMFSNGMKLEDRENLITPQLTKIIDKISKKVPDFYCGRYDIRFKNEDDFKQGKNFYILELNTVRGGDLRMTTKKMFISFIDIFYMMRWFFIRLYYGFINVICGNGANIFKIFDNLSYCIKCKNFYKFVGEEYFESFLF